MTFGVTPLQRPCGRATNNNKQQQQEDVYRMKEASRGEEEEEEHLVCVLHSILPIDSSFLSLVLQMGVRPLFTASQSVLTFLGFVNHFVVQVYFNQALLNHHFERDVGVDLFLDKAQLFQAGP